MEGDMGNLLAALGEAWRSVWTPKAVREIEDDTKADPKAATADMEPPPPPVTSRRQLDAMGERLEQVKRTEHELAELRAREMARLFERRREGGSQ
jgi:hypothetical protein